jgi:nitrogen-specific signal transduction histidine kinase
VAAEINSALQTIVGNCDLLEREYNEPSLRHDLQIIKGQAERITGLLDKMRSAANERLREMAQTMDQEGMAEPKGRRSAAEGQGEEL